MDRDAPLFVFATIKPKPEHFDQARKALEQLVGPTLGEEGCYRFGVFMSLEERGVLHLFECFADADALARHYEMPYTKTIFQQYEDWLETPVVVQKLSASATHSVEQFL